MQRSSSRVKLRGVLSVSKIIRSSSCHQKFFEVPIVPVLMKKVVRELKAANIESAIIRPTGYYSEIGQFVARARKGFIMVAESMVILAPIDHWG